MVVDRRPAFRPAFLVAGGLFALPGMAAAQCEPARAAEKYPGQAGRTVRIAVDATVPPFTYTDPKNLQSVTGLEIDILSRVFTCAGLSYEFVIGNWNAGLAGLLTGAMDVMPDNVNYTPDRAQKADYVLFMRNGSSVAVRKGNPTNIHATQDLGFGPAGLPIGVQLGGRPFDEPTLLRAAHLLER